MTGLTTRLRRRSAHMSALRDLEAAFTEAEQAYARWASDPTEDHYREYLAADTRVSCARREIGSHALADSAAARERGGAPRPPALTSANRR